MDATVMYLTAFLVCVSIANGQLPGPVGVSKNCGPAFHCDLNCPNGYARDPYGCVCKCVGTDRPGGGRMKTPEGAPAPIHSGGRNMRKGGSHVISPLHDPGSSVPHYTVPCVAGLAVCPLVCPSGYRTGKNGCQYCLCAKEARDVMIGSVYDNPCPDAPPTCDAQCAGGSYVTGTNGCQYCSCQDSDITTKSMTSSTPSQTCMVKMTDCQLKCPTGFFMTDKVNCDQCVCESVVYDSVGIPMERRPRVSLDSPCVLGLDICNIVCRSGYHRGPRSCQFCACVS